MSVKSQLIDDNTNYNAIKIGLMKYGNELIGCINELNRISDNEELIHDYTVQTISTMVVQSILFEMDKKPEANLDDLSFSEYVFKTAYVQQLCDDLSIVIINLDTNDIAYNPRKCIQVCLFGLLKTISDKNARCISGTIDITNEAKNRIENLVISYGLAIQNCLRQAYMNEKNCEIKKFLFDFFCVVNKHNVAFIDG
jgi:hypothetical protein